MVDFGIVVSDIGDEGGIGLILNSKDLYVLKRSKC
jgi:hypothetical protein